MNVCPGKGKSSKGPILGARLAGGSMQPTHGEVGVGRHLLALSRATTGRTIETSTARPS
jgi:hypothetical protein